MGLDAILKDVLGDKFTDESAKKLKTEIAKEFVPKKEFNEKLDAIKDLEDNKSTLLKDKEELEKKMKAIEDSKLSDSEKLQKQIELINKALADEKLARENSEKALNDEKKLNSLKSKLNDAKLNSKYLDLVLPKFKDIKDDEFESKLKEFAENNKELFGENQLKGDNPKGSLEDNKQKETKPKSWAEYEQKYG